MYKGNKVVIVVPAYNEENFIEQTINSIPNFVDRIIVVNDASTDSTAEISGAIALNNERVTVINLLENKGVGGAIVTGHKLALKEGLDISVVMGGDNQMDPNYLPAFLEPLAMGVADYAKGNRMSSEENRASMPLFRKFGTHALTILTRISSGYWHINDPQNGYTSITRRTLCNLPLENINKGFAFENDLLIRLRVMGARVVDIPHKAVYCGQVSNINYPSFIVQTGWLLISKWFWRMLKKLPKVH